MKKKEQAVSRVFKKEGTKIIMKEQRTDIELDSKDILDNIEGLNAQINKAKDSIASSEKQIIDQEGYIIEMTNDLSKIIKFKDWALGVQESKVKTIIQEVMPECKDKIDKEYKMDKSMTQENNNFQKMAQLQRALGTNPRMATEINNKIMQQYCFTDCVFDNPWK